MALKSRQTIYTNEDLNKPITGSKSRVYTNADLDVEDDFVPDDFEPDSTDNDDFVPDNEESNPSISAVSDNAPDTWTEGFINSVMGGEALDASLQGAKGFLKGATIDIPSSIWGAAKGAYNLVTDPVNTVKGIPAGIRAMMELTEQAGARPEEFGRMMGQMTGQPLVTGGLVKAAPSVIRGTGAVAENTGRIMRKYAPLSATPIAGPLMGRGAMRLERVAGRGIEEVGKRMRNVGRDKPTTIKAVNDQIVGDVDAPLVEGQPISPDVDLSYRPVEKGSQPKPRARLNPDGTYTNLDTGEIFDSKGMPLAEPQITKNSPFFKRNQSQPIASDPQTRLQQLVDKDVAGTLTAQELKEAQKLTRDLRSMRDRIAEQNTLPEQINPLTLDEEIQQLMKQRSNKPKIAPEARTIENAPPNQRAKIMRGANDSVDVLFSDANSRDLFGAGQSGFSKGEIKPGVGQRLDQAGQRIAEKYGLTLQESKKAIHDYNKFIRDLSGQQPKYGEGLNFKAPSFDDFLKLTNKN